MLSVVCCEEIHLLRLHQAAEWTAGMNTQSVPHFLVRFASKVLIEQAILLKNSLPSHDSLCVYLGLLVVAILLAIPESPRMGMNQISLGVILEVLQANLNAVVGEHVISIQKGHEGTTAVSQGDVIGVRMALVLVQYKKLYSGIFLGAPPYYFRPVVRRAVIHDNNLKIRIRLTTDRIKAFANEHAIVVKRNDYRDKASVHTSSTFLSFDSNFPLSPLSGHLSSP